MSNHQKYVLTWDLDSLLPHPDSEQFSSLLEAFHRDLAELAERSEKLPPVDATADHVAGWVDLLGEYELVGARGGDLASFLGCHAAAEAENKLFQQLEARLSALEPLQERIATNVEFALKEATPECFDAFVQAHPKIHEIEFFLRDRRRRAELRLPKDQELLASELAVDGIHGWGRLYDRLAGALRVKVMERGELVEKSVGQIQLDSPQRAVRQNNFFAARKAWHQIADTCAESLNHIAGTRLTLYGRLGVDHLECPCRDNRMRRETLDTMWRVVTERKGCLLKYLQTKATAFGLDKLTWYDLSAPYPCTVGEVGSNEVTYDEACDLIVQTFDQFSPELGRFARQAIEQRWVEAENRSGKRQGGFCTDFPVQQQSRIFMTFTNSVDATSTLAHELGHAYHTYVLRHQPLFLQGYPMNLAETASTFAEAILGERRLESSESADQQIKILDVMLCDAVSYLMNIHARFIFEDCFHQERAGGELAATRLDELMLDAQRQAYVDGLAEDGWNPGFWISKLHFYISGLPFYNFPYTFGFLLSLGVYAIGMDGSEDFPQQYRQLLIATGCQETEDAVQSTLGYDLTAPDFWNKSLDIIEQRVERFVELATAH